MSQMPDYSQYELDQLMKSLPAEKKKSGAGAFFAGVGITLLLCGIFMVCFMISSYRERQRQEANRQPGETIEIGSYEFLQGREAEILSKLNTLADYIDGAYIEDVELDKLLDGAYHGIVNALGDKYAEYYNSKELEDLTTEQSGEYVGIGVTVQLSGYDVGGLLVISVNQAGAAYEAGIEPGDIVVMADDVVLEDMTLNEMVSFVRGIEGTFVDITFIRDGAYQTVSVERRKLKEIDVYYTMLDYNIGYLSLTGFTENARGQFQSAIDDLISMGMQKLVLDIRDNGGGMVDVCVDIADVIIDTGLVTYLETKSGYQEKYYALQEGELDMPIVLLVNQNSASASELLSLCLRDYDKVTIVGTQTFGKGIAQATYTLKDHTAVKFTIAKYYSPNGTNIHGEGITPDVIVEMPEDVLLSRIKVNGIPDLTKDVQLQKALEILNAQ